MAVQSVKVDVDGVTWRAALQQVDHSTDRVVYALSGPGVHRAVAVPMESTQTVAELQRFLRTQIETGGSGVTLLAEG